MQEAGLLHGGGRLAAVVWLLLLLQAWRWCCSAHGGRRRKTCTSLAASQSGEETRSLARKDNAGATPPPETCYKRNRLLFSSRKIRTNVNYILNTPCSMAGPPAWHFLVQHLVQHSCLKGLITR